MIFFEYNFVWIGNNKFLVLLFVKSNFCFFHLLLQISAKMASLDVSSDSDLEYAIADDLMQDVTERRRRQVLVITKIFYTALYI